ncbi:hypothetical protein J4457_01645 [Candidatus Woesearchaeota archaeon]|nr:hypothetical protein [Candidatus Woesearchaeota archaeon]
MEKMKVKLVKFVEDPCFGEKHNLVEQCKACWIKKSCSVKFKNRKDQ